MTRQFSGLWPACSDIGVAVCDTSGRHRPTRYHSAVERVLDTPLEPDPHARIVTLLQLKARGAPGSTGLMSGSPGRCARRPAFTERPPGIPDAEKSRAAKETR